MAIPTFRGLGQTPAGRFLDLLNPQPVGAPRPVATTSRGVPQPVLRGTPPFMMRPAQQPVMPLRAGMMRSAMQPELTPGQKKEEAPSSGGIMSMVPDVGTPGFAGLSAAAARGLQLSGYHDRPITTGQVLGEMMGAGMDAYTAERKAQQASELAKQQRETDIALKMMEIRATQAKEAFGKDLDIAKLRRDLRKDFDTSSKLFREAKQFWTDVVNYSKPTQSSAADLALVFSYMKMLDPDSVVREGEQMQVRGLGGIGAEARALLSRLGITTEGTYEGGMLIIDPAVRADIRASAALRFADLTGTQKDLEKFTAEEGARAGLTPDFFRSQLKGDGSMKRPFIVDSLADLPSSAKTGDYAIVDGSFQEIKEQ